MLVSRGMYPVLDVCLSGCTRYCPVHAYKRSTEDSNPVNAGRDSRLVARSLWFRPVMTGVNPGIKRLDDKVRGTVGQVSSG